MQFAISATVMAQLRRAALDTAETRPSLGNWVLSRPVVVHLVFSDCGESTEID